jgi:diaminopimelate decarboxylase
LLTRVEFLKSNPEKNFAIVDAAMNDMLRPALYQSWMDIEPVAPRDDTPLRRWDVVGPVCETADFIAKDRSLALQAGDLLALRSAGAYGFVMSSNYNSRGRAAEIMVDDARTYIVRQRESFDDLVRGESTLP